VIQLFMVLTVFVVIERKNCQQLQYACNTIRIRYNAAKVILCERIMEMILLMQGVWQRWMQNITCKR